MGLVTQSISAREQDCFTVAITQCTGAGKTKLLYALAATKWVISILVHPSLDSSSSSLVGALCTKLSEASKRASEAEALSFIDKLSFRKKLTEDCRKVMSIFFHSHLQVSYCTIFHINTSLSY